MEAFSADEVHLGKKDVWSRIGWGMGWAHKCNVRYPELVELHKKVQSLDVAGKLPGSAYSKYAQQRTRFIGNITSQGCSSEKVDSFIEDLKAYLVRFES